MVVLNQSKCFGALHNKDRYQDQSQTDQVQLTGELDQAKHSGKRREQDKQHQQNGYQSSLVQCAVGKDTNFEEVICTLRKG